MDTFSSNASPIPLPRLKKIYLNIVPRGIRDHLLSAIRPTDTLDEACFEDIRIHHLFPNASGSSVHTFVKAVFKEQDHIVWTVNHDPVRSKLNFGNISWIYSSATSASIIRIWDCRRLARVAEFINLTSASDTEVHLILPERRSPKVKQEDIAEFSLDIFNQLPNLCALRIQSRAECIRILLYLAQPRVNTLGEMEWPCPRLRTLDLRYIKKPPLKVLENFKRSRWTSADLGRSRKRPVPLEDLLLRSDT